jgi:thiol:disulfide interchange protein DsbC
MSLPGVPWDRFPARTAKPEAPVAALLGKTGSKRMMKRLLFALMAALLMTLPARADEASVKQAVQTRFGVKVDEVSRTAYGGLYEVRLGNEIVYTDERVTFLMVGTLIDGRTRENVTETRKEKRSAIRFADLPLEAAIKTVRGNGRSQMAVFADPNCGFCRSFERELSTLTDVTIYTFLYPILDDGNKGDSTRKSQAIWCARDRSKAWFDLMLRGVMPPASASCDTSVLQRNLQLGQKLNINGTPTTFVTSGQRIVGARSAEVRKALDSARN